MPNSKDMKTQLNDYIAEIPNAGLRELTHATLMAAPDAFWEAPASSSGKYHREDETAPGGLVRHCKRVFIVARELLCMHDVAPTTPLYSMLLAGALLHDCCKISAPGAHSAFNHPLQAATLIGSVSALLPKGTVSRAALRELNAMVRAHMGRWNTSRHAPGQVLPLPRTFGETLLHTADYIASRKHISIDI